MTQTPEAPDAGSAPRARGGSLNSMLLADLKKVAAEMGIRGAGSMKKAQLVEAIQGARSSSAAGAPDKPAKAPRKAAATKAEKPAAEKPATEKPAAEKPVAEKPVAEKPAKQQAPKQDQKSTKAAEAAPAVEAPEARETRDDAEDGGAEPGEGESRRARRRRGRDRNRTGAAGPGTQGGQTQGGQGNQGNQNQGGQNQGGQGNQNARQDRNEPDTTVLEDDVLVPAAGILDVLDNYAFVRTSGYLPGPDDVYLSLSIVRKFGLRRGDAVVGQVRQPREGERREKFNPMVRIDTVNGHEPDTARTRAEFARLVPVHPTQRLRLETERGDVVGRVLDLAAPLGKGSRVLVTAPHQSGTTSLLRAVASSLTRNNPECHLMVLLLDERPEDVTDFQRSVKGEVIASTFDRAPSDHTAVADLAIERAKRLVELGHDVVLLADGLTRLGRAHHLAAAAAGRGSADGVDAAALLAPKAFFGAARTVENAGSLTIVATAIAESMSRLDQAILEELAGTASAEVRLRRDLAARALHPAVDVPASATRREELLLAEEERAILTSVRRTLADAPPAAGMEALLARVRATQSNIELLGQLRTEDLAVGAG
ncbi:transcription termination factor Rho [Nocardioides sp.]|uniref:transcription termination factor Rho n=1 Tax=Nocardioides sp. TaxID=35761 RepID=UPI0035173088